MTLDFLWELWLDTAEREVGKFYRDDLERIREYFDDGWSALDFAHEVERMWEAHYNPSY
jgi:hypothetical protein